MNTLTEKSKYLAYLLRHKPEAANLTLDKEGWCSLEQLLKNTDFTIEELFAIVGSDSKGRYSFDQPLYSSVHPIKFIRANQGHSAKAVRITFDKVVPSAPLFHGTTDLAFELISIHGLKPMSRSHVHLTDDLDTAKTVAGRRKKNVVILKIDAPRMISDGFEFFRSTNGVYLVAAVPAKYISQELL